MNNIKIEIKQMLLMIKLNDIVTLGPLTLNKCIDGVVLTHGEEITLSDNIKDSIKNYAKELMEETELKLIEGKGGEE